MSVSRDRLPRPIDISALLVGAARKVDLIVDEPGLKHYGLSGGPARKRSPTSTLSVQGGNGSSRQRRERGRVQWVGLGRGRNFRRTQIGRENRVATTGWRERGQSRSALPSWYPRTPLRDITAVVRAIERRRALLHTDRDTQVLQQDNNGDATAGGTSAPLEHEISVKTPIPTIGTKPHHVALSNVKGSESGFLTPQTPQRKLLMSIEHVRDAWLEDQHKLERTPTARRMERERKVRTLMAMR